jgi:chromosome segregation ATPase
MISRVIEAKPEELRVFLEEAAGISKYKERRRETETRLAATRENLSRITDIRLELGAQLEKLEAQAKIAARYKEFQSDLSLKQHLLWYLRRRDAGAERQRHAQEIARVGNEMEAENAQLRHFESRLEIARTTHYQAGDGMNTAQAALYTANATVASYESQLRYAEETRSRLESQHTERRAQLGSWREQRAQLTQALHLWAARSGTAKERAVQASASSSRESSLCRAEEAFALRRKAPTSRAAACSSRRARCSSRRRTSHTLSVACMPWASGASGSMPSCRRSRRRTPLRPTRSRQGCASSMRRCAPRKGRSSACRRKALPRTKGAPLRPRR